MTKIIETFELYGKKYKLETGELAKQATGAVVISQGDTTVLVTAVVSDEKKDVDFLPLTVNYEERMYAACAIPGGYLKREGAPTEKGTLVARMIDRPIRPSFPDGFSNEIMIVAMPLVADQIHQPDIISVMGASAALAVGGVPCEGPIACVRVGRDIDTGKFLINPTYEEAQNSDLSLEIAGTRDHIFMVEASADEVPEDQMLEAFEYGQKALGEFADAIQKFLDKCDIEEKEYELTVPSGYVQEKIFAYTDQMHEALKSADKQERETQVDALKEKIIEDEFTEEEREEYEHEIPIELKQLEKKVMRKSVLATRKRVDGRSPKEIRPITVQPDYLPMVHGSGLFTRGQTQVLSVATLGMLNEWQRLDTIEPVEGKRYIHHYNFPPYSTGETGRMGAPKRREIGHGNLAEKALRPVIPSEEEFPYAIRVVSEVLESNGSSSMASACASSLALFDAGVPLKRPVSGIAMGLISEGDDYVILSDIQGVEDFLGDMDFKVCGTTKGITALQMDNKARGLTVNLLAEALEQAREGRMFILDKMNEKIPEPRDGVKSNAPHIETIQIPVDKIRDIIGSGGKTIRSIQEQTNSTIEVSEDGVVFIASVDAGGKEARKIVEAIVKEPEVGEIYTGTVVGIQPFGAFVELVPGKDGLLHISKMAHGHVDKVEDMFKMGDKVEVEIIDVDDKGKISLDRVNKPDAPSKSHSHKGGNDKRDSKSRGGSGAKPRRRH